MWSHKSFECEVCPERDRRRCRWLVSGRLCVYLRVFLIALICRVCPAMGATAGGGWEALLAADQPEPNRRHPPFKSSAKQRGDERRLTSNIFSRSSITKKGTAAGKDKRCRRVAKKGCRICRLDYKTRAASGKCPGKNGKEKRKSCKRPFNSCKSRIPELLLESRCGEEGSETAWKNQTRCSSPVRDVAFFNLENLRTPTPKSRTAFDKCSGQNWIVERGDSARRRPRASQAFQIKLKIGLVNFCRTGKEDKSAILKELHNQISSALISSKCTAYVKAYSIDIVLKVAPNCDSRGRAEGKRRLQQDNENVCNFASDDITTVAVVFSGQASNTTLIPVKIPIKSSGTRRLVLRDVSRSHSPFDIGTSAQGIRATTRDGYTSKDDGTEKDERRDEEERRLNEECCDGRLQDIGIVGGTEGAGCYIVERNGEEASESPSGSPSKAPSSIPSTPPTAVLSPNPSGIPSMIPSRLSSSHPSVNPSSEPTATPSLQPSAYPSANPSTAPSDIPSARPSDVPSSEPSSSPSSMPSVGPSLGPTVQPSVSPSSAPSGPPSLGPSSGPSASLSLPPSVLPSSEPTNTPSTSPSIGPSSSPSSMPTFDPSDGPSDVPSLLPSRNPSGSPSLAPSSQSSSFPTKFPSFGPSLEPSSQPSSSPSLSPSSQPTKPPSSRPSTGPSLGPTVQPSGVPSKVPSDMPSLEPSSSPSSSPSLLPSPAPTKTPTPQPTPPPSLAPSASPTNSPADDATSMASNITGCLASSTCVNTFTDLIQYDNSPPLPQLHIKICGGSNITVSRQVRLSSESIVICCGGTDACTLRSNGTDRILLANSATFAADGITFIGGIATSLEPFDTILPYSSGLSGGNVAITSGGSDRIGIVLLRNCEFHNGYAPDFGGNMFITVPSGGTITLEGCAFIGGKASFGGGLALAGGARSADIFINDTSFHGNAASLSTAMAEGGGLYYYSVFFEYFDGSSPAVNSSITILQSEFSENRADNGGGLACMADLVESGEAPIGHQDGLTSRMSLQKSTFRNNYAADAGGGAYFFGAKNLTIDQSNFVGNRGFYGGGFVATQLGELPKLTLLNSVYEDNQGGAAEIFLYDKAANMGIAGNSGTNNTELQPLTDEYCEGFHFFLFSSNCCLPEDVTAVGPSLEVCEFF